MQVVLDSLDLAQAERKLCAHALSQAGTIIEAASLLGITRHALKRRITKHRIAWPPAEGPERSASALSSREFAPRVGQGPDPRTARPNLRPPMPTGMRNPNEPPMPHAYGHRAPPMDAGRVRAPAHTPMPTMMGRPDLRKFDR